MAGEGTNVSELYDVAPTIIEGKGINPNDVLKATIADRQAKQAAKKAANQKKFADLDKSINDLESTGWYKHDKTINAKRDSLRKAYEENYIKYGENAFSGKEGQERYSAIQKGISEFKEINLYSGQFQKEYTTERAKIKDPDKYTDESFNNFIEWPKLSFEEQMKAGVPTLKLKKERKDFWHDIDKTSVPYKDYSRESIGTKERDGFLVTKSGKIVDEEALREKADGYVLSGIKGSNPEGEELYNVVLEDLRDSSEGRTLDDTDKDEVSGLTQLESKAAEMASDIFFNQKMSDASTESKTDLAKDPTKTTKEEEIVNEAIPYDGVSVTSRGNLTTTNETIISQTGGGAKEPKTIPINSPTYIGSDDNFVTGNKKIMYISPYKKYDANTAKEDISIGKTGFAGVGGIKIKKGQLITDDEMVEIKAKGLEDKVVKETYLEGVESTTKTIGDERFGKQVSDKKTIKIKYTKQVEESINRHNASVKKQSKKQKELDSKYDSYKPNSSQKSIEDEL